MIRPRSDEAGAFRPAPIAMAMGLGRMRAVARMAHWFPGLPLLAPRHPGRTRADGGLPLPALPWGTRWALGIIWGADGISGADGASGAEARGSVFHSAFDQDFRGRQRTELPAASPSAPRMARPNGIGASTNAMRPPALSPGQVARTERSNTPLVAMTPHSRIASARAEAMASVPLAMWLVGGRRPVSAAQHPRNPRGGPGAGFGITWAARADRTTQTAQGTPPGDAMPSAGRLPRFARMADPDVTMLPSSSDAVSAPGMPRAAEATDMDAAQLPARAGAPRGRAPRDQVPAPRAFAFEPAVVPSTWSGDAGAFAELPYGGHAATGRIARATPALPLDTPASDTPLPTRDPAASPAVITQLLGATGDFRDFVTRELSEVKERVARIARRAPQASPQPAVSPDDKVTRQMLGRMRVIMQEERFRSGKLR